MRGLIWLGLLCPGLAGAQALPTEDVEQRAESVQVAPPPKVDRWRATAELGTALSRGNTEAFQINGSLDVGWAFAEDWLSTTRAAFLYGTAASAQNRDPDDSRTADTLAASERVDRFVSEKLSIFLGVGYDRDAFGGIAGRYSGQAGVGYVAWEARDTVDGEDLLTDRLRFELGGYGAYEEYALAPNAAADAVIDPDSLEIYAARGSAAYLHTFRKGTETGVEVALIQDFNTTDNTVVEGAVWVGAAVVDGLSLKVRFANRWDNLPAPGAEKNDALLTAGIVVTL